MWSRREFVKLAGVVGMAAAGGSLAAGCGEARGTAGPSAASGSSSAEGPSSSSSSSAAQEGSAPSSSSAAASASRAESASAASQPPDPAPAGNAVVVYFSHTGENYGVGYIDQGNTAIVADLIAAKTGADTFEIVPASAYPQGYDECCDVALQEKNAGARPAYAGDLSGFGSYDTVYLGYPIWWGDVPMVVYTFIEAHDWAGKTVLPFCTHAGSGLATTESSLKSACAPASVEEGFAIAGVTAQGSREEVSSALDEWLDARG